MTTLKQMLKNEMDKDETFATKISKVAGYSKPSGFYRFLNDDEKEFKDFNKLINIVTTAFPERESEIMDSYIRTLKPNNKLARQSLEYTSLNKLESCFEYLIDELSKCSNAESKEWASVYKIDHDVIKGKTTQLEAVDKINDLSLKTNEMKAFSRMVKFYCYHDLRMADSINEKSILLENELSNIEDGFIKNNYDARYILLVSAIYLHTNKIETLREKANDLINKLENGNLLAGIYTTIGNSYMIESYDTSLDFLNKAKEIGEKRNNDYRVNECNKSINLLNSLWNKKCEFMPVNGEQNVVLMDHSFNKANISLEDGLASLKQVDIDKINDYSKGFYYFYLGEMTNEEDYYFESIEHFNKSGEKFFKKLPLIKLEKMGIKKSIIRALSV